MSRVDNALLLRDTIQKIVDDKIGKTNPGASYATVTGFNPALGIITVRYPGDDVDIEIPAGSIYPSEVGQVVRIDGPPGARVVADVKGENLTEVKARDAQETADGKNTVNYGETPPEGTDHKDGDIWFDEGNSNMPNVWKDGNWVSIEDLRVAAIAEAQDELRQDLDTVVENGVGTKSFYKPTEPTAAESKEGDLWFDTSESGNNELHTYVNGAWVSAADARIAALKDAQTQMTGDITAAQQKADEAFQDAADADSKAATAQAKADLADDKAQAILRATNSIVPNGDFENTSPNIWPNTTYQRGISIVEADHARSGTHVMRLDSTSGNRYPLTDWRSSGEGRIYYAEVWVYHNDTDMTQRGRVSFYAESEFKDGSTIGYYGRRLDNSPVYVYQDEMTPGVWNKVSAYVTAPEGTINIRVAPHIIRNETPFDLDDFKVIDVTESIAALREANQAKADADTAKSAADAAQATATSAQSAADAAGDAASQAQSKANEAKTAADAAQSTAASAQTAAGTAQSTADAAKSDAAAAAGIANGKGKVLVQSTAPGAADRNAQTLWIDTTGGANTPKRWTTGTTWVAVTDKAATDAASAAVAAQSTADQAKANAATAQAKADQAKAAADAAQTAANNAQSTATEALTSANSKNTVTRSTANPTTPYTGRVDDIWWKMSTLSSGGRVIAQYRWSGTAWLTETIDNAVIANLDAAKITTGYLDAARIKANTLNADTVLINGSLGSIILRDGAITTPKIAVGAITAESGVVASLDAGKITVGTLDVARLAANSITADKVLLTSGSELAADSWFDGVDSVWAGSSAGPGSAITTENPMPGHKYSAKMNPYTSGSSALYAPFLSPGSKPGSLRIPCQPGETYDIYAWVMRADGNASNVGNVDCRVYAYTSPYDSGSANNSNGRAGGPISGETFPVAEWVKVGGSYTVPAGRYSFTPRLTVYTKSGTAGNWPSSGASTWYVGAYSIMRQVGSTLIEPGAITTEKIAVGAITAESGVIGSLDASKITVGKLSGARLEADAINGMQIIGATIATSTGFPRVQLDNAGLHVYSSSAVRSFFADATTGNLSIVGDLSTAASGARAILQKSSSVFNGNNSGLSLVDSDGSMVTFSTSGGGSGFNTWRISGLGAGAIYSSSNSLGMTAPGGKATALVINNSGSLETSAPSIAGGSLALLGAGDYGIEADSGNRLVLRSKTGSALIKATTIAFEANTITGLPIATGDGVDFPTVAANGGSQTVTINFPSGKFSVAPSVSAMTSHGRVTPVVFNITKTGFSFRVWNFTSSSAPSVVGTWMAVAAS